MIVFTITSNLDKSTRSSTAKSLRLINSYNISGTTPDINLERIYLRNNRDLGQKLTEDDYQNACNEREVFRKFLHHEIFTEGTIMLLPNGDFDISYRDHLSACVFPGITSQFTS
jgi:hypothetical protein